jgi:Tfp pilus assembly protein PilO
MNSDQKIDNEKIEALKKEIETLKSQWPAHSVPAAMLQRLEELEEELEKELQNNADA